MLVVIAQVKIFMIYVPECDVLSNIRFQIQSKSFNQLFQMFSFSSLFGRVTTGKSS